MNRNLERGNGIWQCEKKEFDGIIEGGGVGGEAAHNGLKLILKEHSCFFVPRVCGGRMLVT